MELRGCAADYWGALAYDVTMIFMISKYLQLYALHVPYDVDKMSFVIAVKGLGMRAIGCCFAQFEELYRPTSPTAMNKNTE